MKKVIPLKLADPGVMIRKLLAGHRLTEAGSQKMFAGIFSGHYGAEAAKDVLLLMAHRGESAAEVMGCWKALRELEPPRDAKIGDLMDTCGTGWDASRSINVSTLAAVVVAGAGGRVAKHGNRAISSKSGSSDLLESFGVRLDAKPKMMIRAIQQAGIGYFHAPFYHPVFGGVQALRRKIGTRTIFNLLGPLIHPLRITRQLVGVSRHEWLAIYAHILVRRHMKRALVCRSRYGMDEISTRALTDAWLIEGARASRIVIDPKRLWFSVVSPRSYRGGDVGTNRRLAEAILSGTNRDGARDLVVLNAAAGLFVAGLARDLREGREMAERSIDSGEAFRRLRLLARMTQEEGAA